MKYLFKLLIIFAVLLVGCSDNSDNGDSPQSQTDKLVGYWAISHIKTIEHIGGLHNTVDLDIPPHGLDSYVSDENYRYDVLIFDEEFVTVRGDMPSKPKQRDYDDTSEGMIRYNYELNDWYNAIASYTDRFECPVGTYSVKSNDLLIGSLNMGSLNFSFPNEFTLDYTKTLSNQEDYRRLIYTYTRIYSLTL